MPQKANRHFRNAGVSPGFLTLRLVSYPDDDLERRA
jgi:hypothetical protein